MRNKEITTVEVVTTFVGCIFAMPILLLIMLVDGIEKSIKERRAKYG